VQKTSERCTVSRIETTDATLNFSNAGNVAKNKLDSHANTICAGKNCMLMYYTNRACDIMPFSDTYDAKTDVPIVTACTAYQCPQTGQVCILVLNEALWFGDEGGMDHTLLNPNQLRNFQLDVHDTNPFDRTTDLHIDTQSDLQIPLKNKGTVIYFNTWAHLRALRSTTTHTYSYLPQPNGILRRSGSPDRRRMRRKTIRQC
jgi:hypothetical protein